MTRLYMLFALLGLMSVPAAFIMGFRHDATAPLANYAVNAALFVAFMAIHMIMMRPGFKRAIYGRAESMPAERRIYITVSIVTWVALYALHRPVPGFAFEAGIWLQYLGVCGVLLGAFMFFEGATFAMLEGLVGKPGVAMSHSTDTATPLMTEGSYARIRHPMYRGALTYLGFSMLIHPHAGQLLFVLLVAAGFVLFIPVEERALLRARGDEYRLYMTRVRYRIIPGIW